MRIAMIWGVFGVAIFGAGTAAADPTLTPIVDRNYALDMWSSIPFGDSTALGMGGANVAQAYGSSGALDNPAAAAIPKATDDVWGFDYHIDYLNGSLSSDYGNAGVASFPTMDSNGNMLAAPDTREQQLTLGGALRVYGWGAAISATARSMRISDVMQTSGGGSELYAESLLFKGSIAHFFEGPDIAFGAAAQLAVFNMQTDCTGPQCGSLFTVSGWGTQFGLTWLPHMQSFRFGGVLSTGITGTDISGSCVDAMNCGGFDHPLPEKVAVPATATVGVAYRIAGTAWNQHVHGAFRDEMSLTLAFDAVMTAPVSDAYGLDAFGIGYLEQSDAHFGVSPRGGMEWEMIPGRFRLRGGSYWEPSRFDGVEGRLHGTFGLELRVFEVDVWGLRRGRITLTGDLAHDYSNLGISIGLWH